MSDIAELCKRITAECEASWQALHGIAAGTAQHAFIRARFRIMESYHQRLRDMVGEDEARTILGEIYVSQANQQGGDRDGAAPVV